MDSVLFMILSIVLLIISYFQFQEKGFLLNNIYIWASKEERIKMDNNKEKKHIHYRQSAYVFLLLGISLASYSLYCYFDLYWIYIIFWILLSITLIFTVVSSIQMNNH